MWYGMDQQFQIQESSEAFPAMVELVITLVSPFSPICISIILVASTVTDTGMILSNPSASAGKPCHGRSGFFRQVPHQGGVVLLVAAFHGIFIEKARTVLYPRRFLIGSSGGIDAPGGPDRVSPSSCINIYKKSNT
jgi:hypothetical protein